MKRLLSLALIFCLAIGIVACADGMSAAENALIAIKALDLEAFSSNMTADSEAALDRIATHDAALDEHERETMQTLYNMIRYTIGEESAVSNGEKTITVTVKAPDFARVRNLAEKQILVSAKTADAVISEMLASGEIEKNYMLDLTWQITLKEEDGKWLIPYSETQNKALIEGLYLVEMFRFFAQN